LLDPFSSALNDAIVRLGVGIWSRVVAQRQRGVV